MRNTRHLTVLSVYLLATGLVFNQPACAERLSAEQAVVLGIHTHSQNQLTVSPLTENDELFNRAYRRLLSGESDFWLSLIPNQPKSSTSPGNAAVLNPVDMKLKGRLVMSFGDPEHDRVWFLWDARLGRVLRIEILDIIGDRLAVLHPASGDRMISWNVRDRVIGIAYYQIVFKKDQAEYTLPLKKIAVFR